MLLGANEQIQRITKLLGYEYAWSAPHDESRWFMQRPASPGRIEVASLDATILALLEAAGKPRKRKEEQSMTKEEI